MSFELDGFLAEFDLYSNHKDYFDFSINLNRFASVIFNSKVKVEQNSDFIPIIIFLKILRCYQSNLILLRKGMQSEVKIVIRTMIEAIFILKTITLDRNEINAFNDSCSSKQAELLKKIGKNKDNFFNNICEKITMEEISIIIEELIQDNQRGITYWVKKSSLTDLYTPYILFCDYVHINLKNLVKTFILDTDKIILKFEPEEDEIKNLLYLLNFIIIESIECINVIYNLDIQLNDKLEEMNTIFSTNSGD